MASCGNCGAAIVWARLKTRLPFEESLHGRYALLLGRLAVEAPYASFAELPSHLRALIPDDTLEAWRRALDGPRYQLHSKDCRELMALHINPKRAIA